MGVCFPEEAEVRDNRCDQNTGDLVESQYSASSCHRTRCDRRRSWERSRCQNYTRQNWQRLFCERMGCKIPQCKRCAISIVSNRRNAQVVWQNWESVHAEEKAASINNLNHL